MISVNVSRNFRLPLVPVIQQFFLIVQQFLVAFRGKLEIRALDDRVHRTRLLTKPAVNALGHVDVVARRAPRSVRSLLRLDRYGLKRPAKSAVVKKKNVFFHF